MTATAKNVYIDEIQETNTKYNNNCHFHIKKEATDLISHTVMEYIT